MLYNNKNLSEPWFSLIKFKIKQVEGRLNKGDFKNMEVGDEIEFTNNDFGFQRSYIVKIKSIIYSFLFTGIFMCIVIIFTFFPFQKRIGRSAVTPAIMPFYNSTGSSDMRAHITSTAMFPGFNLRISSKDQYYQY